MEIELIKFLQSGKNQFFDIYFGIFSYLAGFLGFFIVFFILFIKNKKFSYYFLFNFFILNIFNYFLKLITNRPRPYEISKEVVSTMTTIGKSFPSAHMACATLICFFCLYLIFKQINNKSIKTLSIIIALLYCACVGISRMYFGQHYLSDIFAGFFVAAFLGAISLILLHKKLYKKIWK